MVKTKDEKNREIDFEQRTRNSFSHHFTQLKQPYRKIKLVRLGMRKLLSQAENMRLLELKKDLGLHVCFTSAIIFHFQGFVLR